MRNKPALQTAEETTPQQGSSSTSRRGSSRVARREQLTDAHSIGPGKVAPQTANDLHGLEQQHNRERKQHGASDQEVAVAPPAALHLIDARDWTGA